MRVVVVAGALCLALVGACGTDGSPLARRPEVGGGGFGDGGGMGGAGATATTSVGEGGAGGIVEPPGPTRLTVVNGIVDAEAARFCFVPFPDGTSPGAPWPGPEGLGYARAARPDLATVIPAGTDVEVIAVAGALDQEGGASCDRS